MTILDLRPKSIYRVPRFAYLGAGAKVDELPRWLKFLEQFDFERYVDLTAGSNNQPYAVSRYFQRDVIVNDVCYYSHLIAKATLERHDAVPEGTIASAIAFAKTNKKPGRFSKNEEWDCGPNGRAIKLLIDGLAPITGLKFNGKDVMWAQPFILACAGSAILQKLTMRGTGLHSIKGKQADGTIATRDTVVDELWRKAHACNPCVARTGSNNVALLGTLLEALEKLDAMPGFGTTAMGRHGLSGPYVKTSGAHSLTGCIVNVDYAWPYEKNDNPYYSYLDVSDFLGSPLDRKTFHYWKDETTENVLKEVLHMTKEILKRKPVRFFLWNQSTNRPAPELVLEHLGKAGIQVQECLRIKRITTSGKSTFEDVVLEMRP